MSDGQLWLFPEIAPRSAPRRQSQLIVRLFGLDVRARYDMIDRSRTTRWRKARSLDPIELHASVRGAAIAALLAAEGMAERVGADDQDLHDLRVALINAQRSAAELARRLLRGRVRIAEANEGLPTNLFRSGEATDEEGVAALVDLDLDRDSD
jgi:hypothetical protein